ncbi:MAG: sugar transferase [Prevotella sp.]|nr:sugar transferase [Prevotella sp.]
MKRIFDIIVAAVCLVVFSPLILVCWLVIKIGGGPAIYKQERIGLGGQPFYIYKFRSMVVDAEKEGEELLQKENDPRLTRIGKFLRNHHLDELPQLWNVLKGDMSFIGPRPERKYFIDQIMQIDPRYEQLYQLRPGVTSYATLYNGYTDTMDKMLRRLELDLYYLEHRSWWFDLKIIMKTFLNIIFGKKF